MEDGVSAFAVLTKSDTTTMPICGKTALITLTFQVGSVVKAGDVIGYVGKTGYSTVENTDNITSTHLHWGVELIFDESQKDAPTQIWIDLYEITKLLNQNKSQVYRVDETKEYYRKYDFLEDNLLQAYQNTG